MKLVHVALVLTLSLVGISTAPSPWNTTVSAGSPVPQPPLPGNPRA